MVTKNKNRSINEDSQRTQYTLPAIYKGRLNTKEYAKSAATAHVIEI